MWLKLLWKDNRLIINQNNASSQEVIDLGDVKVFQLKDKQIIHNMWLPDLWIPHQSMSKVSHGAGFHEESISFTVNDGNIWIDYWRWLKLTTTCPMSFNWFPLDNQNCHFNIRVKKLYQINLSNGSLGRRYDKQGGFRKPSQISGLFHDAFPECSG